ncbi:hypothetical protein, partial [Photobacterium damselae]|uniref:hypothetical protein n=1 Tax=Photobacterium damselae TaxID=38293 RepID=UPI0040688EB7
GKTALSQGLFTGADDLPWHQLLKSVNCAFFKLVKCDNNHKNKHPLKNRKSVSWKYSKIS